MFTLVLGLVFFLGAHAFSLARGPRAAAIERFGAGGFKGIYSAASLVGLIMIIWGFARYRSGGMIPLWDPPVWLRHLSLVVMLPVLPLLFGAYGKGYIKARLKHPMILAVKTWALAHLLANGDLGSAIMFGGFLVWAVVGFAMMRRRPEPALDFVPNPGVDAAAVIYGLIGYIALVAGLHRWLIGVGVFG
jgi:uncharacterized membrane protein